MFNSNLVSKVLFVLLSLGLSVQASASPSAGELTPTEIPLSSEHKKWLHDRFNDQHQKLIPVVAVADMVHGCQLAKARQNKAKQNNAKKNSQVMPQVLPLVQLIVELDRNALAEQLISCLGESSVQSEQALNYGVLGCFSEQLSRLTAVEKEAKMQQVRDSLKLLPKAERQKSFTKCVTEQAINYLK